MRSSIFGIICLTCLVSLTIFLFGIQSAEDMKDRTLIAGGVASACFFIALVMRMFHLDEPNEAPRDNRRARSDSEWRS